jgi:hypothetical protein
MAVPIIQSSIGAAVFVILVVVALKFLPRRLKQSYFVMRWKRLQAHCRTREGWPKALEEADRLLNYALKKQRFRGRTMGEKMVSAQHVFTDNDALWRAHNLFKKLASAKSLTKIKESEVKDAMVGFRRALRDIGALPKDESSTK